MSPATGTLVLAVRSADGRTILERVRYEGVSRCSRAFREGEAARVVLSSLGPGVVRGDHLEAAGTLGADAHLIVTQQTATRLLGGPRPSRAVSAWTLGERALLELVGEPLVAAADADYDAWTTIDLGPGSRVLISEIACVARGAAVRLRTSVRSAGREIFYDAFDAAAAAPRAVGTFAIVGPQGAQRTQLVEALDAAAGAVSAPDLRVGIGELAHGAFGRVLSADIWAVRAALQFLRQAAIGPPARAASQRAGGVTPSMSASRSTSSAGSTESSLVPRCAVSVAPRSTS